MQLDQFQSSVRSAVLRPGGNLRVTAAAGSGKTATLVATISALVAQGVDPGDIIATTFTNKAGKELRDRLLKVLPAAVVNHLSIGTFHALALQSLRECSDGELDQWNMKRCLVVSGRLAGIPHEKSLWQSILMWRADGVWGTGVKSLQLPTVTKETVGNYMLANSVMRGSGYSIDTMPPNADERDGLDRFADAVHMYEAAKTALQAFDFDDVLSCYRTMLESGEIRATAKYVFVDEAQDNSILQNIIARLLSVNGRLIRVGDGRQAIYSWRGAAPEEFLRQDTSSGATSLSLRNNYRSGKRIVDVGNAIAKGQTWATGGEAYGARRTNGTVRSIHGYDGADEAAVVATEIAAAMNAGAKLHDIAILCRTNVGAAAFEGALMSLRIPVVRLGGKPFWEYKASLDFLGYLILSEFDSFPALERIYNVPSLPKRYLGKAFLSKVKECMDLGAEMIPAIMTAAMSLKRGPAKGARDLAGILRAVRQDTWGERCGHLAKMLEPPAKSDKGDTDTVALIYACADMAARFDNVTDLVAYADACTANTLIAKAHSDGEASKRGRVMISTIHGAKGLEWETVYVSASHGVFPHQRNMGNEKALAEEQRLFYVATTRARDNLILSHADTDPKGPAGPSEYTVKYVWPHLTSERQ